MSVSIFRLPPELIELVIRKNEHHQSTLRSCALVCRAFRHPSQGAIFAAINLGPQIGSAPRFHAFLLTSPHLAAHVRKLTIVEVGHASESWYPSLALLLDLLHVVKTFALVLNSQWPLLPADLQIAICAFCARSALVSLRFVNVGTLNSLAEFSQLVASTALKDLWLKGLRIPPAASADAIPIAPTNAMIALTNFQLDLDVATLSIVTPWLVEHGSLLKLQYLSFVCTRETASHLRALTTEAPNLENITLELCDAEFTTDFPPLHFGGALPRLHKVTISLEVDITRSERLPRGLAALLESCSPGLTTFSVVIHPSARDQQQHPVVDMDWAPVADVVTPARFPVLQKLVFVLFPSRAVTAAVLEKLMADMRSGLPELHARGILKASALGDTLCSAILPT